MGELNDLIKSIEKLDTAAWPLREMEMIIAYGAEAAGPVIECLKNGEPCDELPFIVILGLIGSPQAVPVLIGFMRDIRKSAEAAAAAEGLARIGSPAFPAIREAAEQDASVPARVMAYGALGYMQAPEAYESLTGRLGTDPEAADAVALALSLYGKKEDVGRLYAKYISLPPGFMRNNFEEAVHFCAHPGAAGVNTMKEDWRIRYRRLPELDHFPVPSPFELIALLHAGKAEPVPEEPAKKLEDILAHRDGDDHGECGCGGSHEDEPMENRTGIAVCFEDLPTIIAFQKAILREYMKQGCATMQQSYDLLDTFFEHVLEEKDDTLRGQKEEMYNIGCATIDYLLKRGIHDLSKGVDKLEDIERLVAEEYKYRLGRFPDVSSTAGFDE